LPGAPLIIIVAAMTRNHVIGKDNRIPWHIDEETRHYRNLVEGKTLLMGRATFDLMKHPYAHGHDIVVTHSKINHKAADVCGSVDEALKKAKEYGPDVFVIGGQSIYEQTIGIADMILLSYIKKDYEGNKFFPEFSKAEWREASVEEFTDFTYAVYIRKKKLGSQHTVSDIPRR
jgi:dihydrofolate reductase